MASNKPLITFADDVMASFGTDLAKVMAELETSLIAVVNGAQTSADVFNANAILNSRPVFIQALSDAGYNDLVTAHLAKYSDVPSLTSKAFTGSSIPAPTFTAVDAEIFTTIARADLEGFASIGTKALDDLRLGLYRQAVSSQPFTALVESVRASTVGLAGSGSPLSNFAYTHANTAILNFEGEVLKVAGESIGFGEDGSLWEVVGPDDDRNRDVCDAALANPIRTRAEWLSAEYFGGTPGGWNCRHQLFPFIGVI